MTCEYSFEDLLAYEGDELVDSKRTRFEEHLKTCSSCSARLVKLQAMEGSLRAGLSEPEIVPDITDAVMSQVMPEPVRSLRGLVWACAACSVAIAACLFLIFIGKPDTVDNTTGKVPAVVKVQDPKSAPLNPVPVKKPEKIRPIAVAPKRRVQKLAYLDKARRFQNTPEPAEPAYDTSLRVEISIKGNQQRIVLAVDSAEHEILSLRRDSTALMPPNPEAAEIKRPPLQTVVSADPGVALVSGT